MNTKDQLTKDFRQVLKRGLPCTDIALAGIFEVLIDIRDILEKYGKANE